MDRSMSCTMISAETTTVIVNQIEMLAIRRCDRTASDIPGRNKLKILDREIFLPEKITTARIAATMREPPRTNHFKSSIFNSSFAEA